MERHHGPTKRNHRRRPGHHQRARPGGADHEEHRRPGRFQRRRRISPFQKQGAHLERNDRHFRRRSLRELLARPAPATAPACTRSSCFFSTAAGRFPPTAHWPRSCSPKTCSRATRPWPPRSTASCRSHRRLLLEIDPLGQRQGTIRKLPAEHIVHPDHGLAAPAGPAMAGRRLRFRPAARPVKNYGVRWKH